MRRLRPLVLALLCALAAATPRLVAQDQPPERTQGAWLEVEIGLIGPASDDILQAAMERVKADGLAGLVIRLDTPGGALDSTRNMVKLILGAPFPVVVWVGPAGSRAGSAGAFITLAAHVAAMAPGTNIGAAHPVGVGIGGGGGEDGGSEMDRKVTNDTVAFIESIAKTRGRNVEMARSFVATSVSITDSEALDNKVIDVVAKDMNQLFAAIDGREVTLDNGRRLTLATKDAGRIAFDKSLRQELLEILSNPNLFYLLFMAGLIGIGYELTHPGLMLPGVVGAICMICALIATSVLPVSFGAAALILVGVGLLIAEAFVPSFGVLGVGGFTAFVLGSVFLVDPKNEAGLRISWYAIAPGAVTVGAAFLALGYLILRSRTAPVRSGVEGLVGQMATALQDFTDQGGQVRVAGAIWSAVLEGSPAAGPVLKGEHLRVRSVDGLTVRVAKLS